jgi:TPR repeat protein
LNRRPAFHSIIPYMTQGHRMSASSRTISRLALLPACLILMAGLVGCSQDAGEAAHESAFLSVTAFELAHQEGIDSVYEYLNDAVADGSVEAEYWLGFFAQGEGDQEKAYRWFRSGAEKENDKAQYALHLIYRDGRGVETDREHAIYWLRRAAGNGNENAVRELRSMENAGVL